LSVNDQSWFQQHPILTLLGLAGLAFLVWFFFFRKHGAAAALPALQEAPEILVSSWSPLP
jgi:LPXTG-motif cell wall-anchored protein